MFKPARMAFAAVASTALLLSGAAIKAEQVLPPAAPAPTGGDIPANFKIDTEADDYIKRDVMIPMRDGVNLPTVIILPRVAPHAPMILDRAPYNAHKCATAA